MNKLKKNTILLMIFLVLPLFAFKKDKKGIFEINLQFEKCTCSPGQLKHKIGIAYTRKAADENQFLKEFTGTGDNEKHVFYVESGIYYLSVKSCCDTTGTQNCLTMEALQQSSCIDTVLAAGMITAGQRIVKEYNL